MGRRKRERRKRTGNGNDREMVRKKSKRGMCPVRICLNGHLEEDMLQQ